MLGQSVMQWDKGTIMMVMIFSIPIIAIIGGLWLAFEKNRSDNELKRSMIERGMSVEEIERVIKAKGK